MSDALDTAILMLSQGPPEHSAPEQAPWMTRGLSRDVSALVQALQDPSTPIDDLVHTIVEETRRVRREVLKALLESQLWYTYFDDRRLTVEDIDGMARKRSTETILRAFERSQVRVDNTICGNPDLNRFIGSALQVVKHQNIPKDTTKLIRAYLETEEDRLALFPPLVCRALSELRTNEARAFLESHEPLLEACSVSELLLRSRAPTA